MQHAATITKPGHAFTIEQVRVNACHLRGHVGAHAHGATGELIHQLIGLQLKVLAVADKERVGIFNQRRRDQFETAVSIQVQHRTTQLFDSARFCGQNIG